MNIKILLIFGLLISLASASQCDDYINEMIQSNFSNVSPFTILYSGLSPNCPGMFVECTAVKNFSYYLTYKAADFSIDNKNVTSKDLAGYFNGLCIPSFCKPQDIKKFPIYEKAVIVEYEDDNMTVLGWIGVGLFITYLTLILIATLLSNFKKSKKVHVHEEPSANYNQKRMSIQDDDKDINPSYATSSLHQPFLQHSKQPTTTILQDLNAHIHYDKIFESNPTRNVLFGPKCIAILMIIVAIQYSYRQNVAMNHLTAASLLSRSIGYLVTNVQLAYATLFWIFGINAAYALYKIKTLNDVFKCIINKLTKTWIALVFYILFAYGLSQLTISQPLSGLWDILFNKDCHSTFWRKWFLVNTMIPDNTTCLPWTWVFEVEILLYILSPLVVILLKAKKWLGYLVFVLILICSLTYSFVVLEADKIPFYPSLLFNNSHSYVYYFQMHPLTRASQFYLGLYLGLFINQALDKLDESNKRPKEYAFYKFLKNSRLHQWIMQIVGLAFVCTSFFLIVSINDEDSRSTFVRIFIVLIPFALLIGLSLLVLPSFFHGKGHFTRLINILFASSAWAPLHKLSNSIYLTAPIVIGLTTYSLQTGIYYSYEQVSLLFLGDLALILFFSIIVCAALEMTLHELQKRLESKLFGNKLNHSIVHIDE